MLRCLVNKSIAILLTPPALAFQAPSSTLLYPSLFDTIYEPKHSIVHSFCGTPLHLLPHCLHRAPFRLLLTLSSFRTRHNSEYSPSICGILRNPLGVVRKLTLSISGIFGYINYLVERDRKFILDTLVNGQPPFLGWIQLAREDYMLTLFVCRPVTSRVPRV